MCPHHPPKNMVSALALDSEVVLEGRFRPKKASRIRRRRRRRRRRRSYDVIHCLEEPFLSASNLHGLFLAANVTVY